MACAAARAARAEVPWGTRHGRRCGLRLGTRHCGPIKMCLQLYDVNICNPYQLRKSFDARLRGLRCAVANADKRSLAMAHLCLTRWAAGRFLRMFRPVLSESRRHFSTPPRKLPPDGLSLAHFVAKGAVSPTISHTTGPEQAYAFNALRDTDHVRPQAPRREARSFHIETFGCQMNVNDSQIVAAILTGMLVIPTRYCHRLC